MCRVAVQLRQEGADLCEQAFAKEHVVDRLARLVALAGHVQHRLGRVGIGRDDAEPGRDELPVLDARQRQSLRTQKAQVVAFADQQNQVCVWQVTLGHVGDVAAFHLVLRVVAGQVEHPHRWRCVLPWGEPIAGNRHRDRPGDLQLPPLHAIPHCAEFGLHLVIAVDADRLPVGLQPPGRIG